MTEDIWKQPAKGFNKDNIGRTEAQIVQKESEIGFNFPSQYRTHMKMQNGGYLWKSALIYKGEVEELLCNGATIDPILNIGGYKTLKDVLREYMDEDELESASEYEFLDLDRLPILSHMDGHTMLCFDYGYNVEKAYEIPEIVLFDLEGVENGYEERKRVKSYDEFINNLVYFGYESLSFYIGLKSEESIDKIAADFGNTFDVSLELKEDDGLGWFNFEKWYRGKFELNSSLSVSLDLTPNQFLSNTSLFQNHKDFNYILDIQLWNGEEIVQENPESLKSIIEDGLQIFLSKFQWEYILVPFDKKSLANSENEADTNVALELPEKREKSHSKSMKKEEDTNIQSTTDNDKQKSWWKRFWS